MRGQRRATGACCEQHGAGPAGGVSLPHVGFQPRRETLGSFGLSRTTALALFALVATASPARAEVVTDPMTDFRVELDLHTKDSCVVIPRDRARGAFCDEVHAPALADSLDDVFDQPFYGAIGREGQGFVIVSITRHEVRDPLGPDQLGDFAEKTRTEISTRAHFNLAEGAPPPRIDRLRGVEVAVVPMRGKLQSEQGDAIPETMTSYTLFGARASYQIVTQSDAEHDTEAGDVVSAALATMTLAPVAAAGPKTTLGGDLRQHAGAVAIAAVVLLALIFGAFRFTRDPPAPDVPEGSRFRTRKRKVVSWEKGDR